MITNIVASIIICVATNVSERLPTHRELAAPPEGANPVLAVVYYKDVPDANPTNKWVRTSITETTNLVYAIAGQTFTNQLGVHVVSDTEVEFHRSDRWSATATNDVRGMEFSYGRWTGLWRSGGETYSNSVVNGVIRATNFVIDIKNIGSLTNGAK